MKRHNCIECKKKRYCKYMVKVDFLKTNVFYNTINKHWVCKECLKNYIDKLSKQVIQINFIIKKSKDIKI